MKIIIIIIINLGKEQIRLQLLQMREGGLILSNVILILSTEYH